VLQEDDVDLVDNRGLCCPALWFVLHHIFGRVLPRLSRSASSSHLWARWS